MLSDRELAKELDDLADDAAREVAPRHRELAPKVTLRTIVIERVKDAWRLGWKRAFQRLDSPEFQMEVAKKQESAAYRKKRRRESAEEQDRRYHESSIASSKREARLEEERRAEAAARQLATEQAREALAVKRRAEELLQAEKLAAVELHKRELFRAQDAEIGQLRELEVAVDRLINWIDGAGEPDFNEVGRLLKDVRAAAGVVHAAEAKVSLFSSIMAQVFGSRKKTK